MSAEYRCSFTGTMEAWDSFKKHFCIMDHGKWSYDRMFPTVIEVSNFESWCKEPVKRIKELGEEGLLRGIGIITVHPTFYNGWITEKVAFVGNEVFSDDEFPESKAIDLIQAVFV
ncbi:hypothetical protein D6833_06955 [Candidatus Parcubacteria bacterium]|nr:MAG: hypothetical protein D6833_06955 [Candidatus Parcubacteria bacterium]